jgi:hypothetical protein
MVLLLATTASVSTDAAAAPPVFPGAKPAAAPAGLGEKPLPKSARVYVTDAEFATVRAWYRNALKGVSEIAQPGKENTMDAFLLGSGPSARVLMIQRLDGKTWIAIAPPV